MAINKVNFGNTTLMDITDTTATASDVASGKYFYTKDGTKTAGTASGGSSWTLLGSTEVTVSTTETTAKSVTTLSLPGIWNKDKIIYVRVRDKAGKRAGYYLGCDAFFINFRQANNSSSDLAYAGRILTYYTTSNQYGQYVGSSSTSYGVYPYSITSGNTLKIYRRYHSSNSLTINGTYKIDIYTLDYPDGKSVYNFND